MVVCAVQHDRVQCRTAVDVTCKRRCVCAGLQPGIAEAPEVAHVDLAVGVRIVRLAIRTVGAVVSEPGV